VRKRNEPSNLDDKVIANTSPPSYAVPIGIKSLRKHSLTGGSGCLPQYKGKPQDRSRKPIVQTSTLPLDKGFALIVCSEISLHGRQGSMGFIASTKVTKKFRSFNSKRPKRPFEDYGGNVPLSMRTTLAAFKRNSMFEASIIQVLFKKRKKFITSILHRLKTTKHNENYFKLIQGFILGQSIRIDGVVDRLIAPYLGRYGKLLYQIVRPLSYRALRRILRNCIYIQSTLTDVDELRLLMKFSFKSKVVEFPRLLHSQSRKIA